MKHFKNIIWIYAIILLIGIHFTTAALTDNNIVYYNFNNGIYTLNSVNNNFNILNDTNTSYTPGIIGGGRSFNGLNSYMIETNYTQTTNPFTACAWFKSNVTNKDNIILGIARNIGSGYNWVIDTDSTAHLRLELYDGLHNPASISNLTFTANTWTYICGSYDGSIMRTYFNGSLSGENSTNININGGNVSIGVYPGTIGNGGFWNGSIDEVSVWNRTLSASEVLQLYNNGTGYSLYNNIVFGSLSINSPANNSNVTYNTTLNFTDDNLPINYYNVTLNNTLVGTFFNTQFAGLFTSLSSLGNSPVLEANLSVNGYVFNFSGVCYSANSGGGAYAYSQIIIYYNDSTTNTLGASCAPSQGGMQTPFYYDNPYADKYVKYIEGYGWSSDKYNGVQGQNVWNYIYKLNTGTIQSNNPLWYNAVTTTGRYNLNVSAYDYYNQIQDYGINNITFQNNALLNITLLQIDSTLLQNFTVGILDINKSINTNYSTLNGLIQADITKLDTYNITFYPNSISTLSKVVQYNATTQTYQTLQTFYYANISIYDEARSLINLTYFNFSDPTQLIYSAYCTNGQVISTQIPNTTGQGPYSSNLPCQANKIKFSLEYTNADGSTTVYYRVVLIPPNTPLNNFPVFLPDLKTTTIVQVFLEPYDLLGQYTTTAQTQILATEQMPSGTQLITSDYMESTGTVGFFLVQGNQYVLTIMGNNLPTRVIGGYSADSSGTFPLQISSIKLASNVTVSAQSSNQFSQIVNTSTPNVNLVQMIYYDPTSNTNTLTMSIYNGTCNNLGALLVTKTLNNLQLSSSGYQAVLSQNVFGSRIANSTSSQTYYCTKFSMLYLDGTTQTTNTTLAYDNNITIPGIFTDQWTFPWIIFLVLLVIAMGLNARTVSYGSILVAGLAMILYSWNWYATGSLVPGVQAGWAISIALIIAILLNIKRVI